jgi:hypothetical protein
MTMGKDDVPVILQLPLGKRKERSPQELSVLTCKARDAKQIAVEDALLPHDDISSPSEGKEAGEDTSPYVCWLELIEGHEHPVDLDEMSHACVNSIFPIIYCTNNKNIMDDANWAPCILWKVRKEQYEVLDMQEQSKIDEDLDWGGDDGLSASLSMYYKYSTNTYVNLFRIELENYMNDNIAHNISPRHFNLHKQATANVQRKAHKVAAQAAKKSPGLVFKIGDVVLVPLDDVDCTKVDGANLAGVIVLINKDKSTCCVAVMQGVLHRAYAYHCLKPVPAASKNLDVMDLQDAYENWRSLPKLTEREAARYISSVKGQGVIHCNCRGSCTTNSCSCRNAGRLCSSRCHRNSKQCKISHDTE